MHAILTWVLTGISLIITSLRKSLHVSFSGNKQFIFWIISVSGSSSSYWFKALLFWRQESPAKTQSPEITADTLMYDSHHFPNALSVKKKKKKKKNVITEILLLEGITTITQYSPSNI